MEDDLDTVKRMWVAYREEGVDTALRYLDDGVVVAGHRRIGEGADYLYFSHHVKDGTITRIAAWFTRDAAIADVT